MKPFLLFCLLVAMLSGGPAVAQTGVLGKNWTLEHPLPTAENLMGIAVDGSTSMVAVGGHGAVLTASTVAGTASWTLNTTNTSADLWDVIWTGTQYVAVGSGGTVLTAPDTLASTPTGLTWTLQTHGLNTTDQLNSIATDGTALIAVGVSSTGVGVAAVSQDSGVTWTRTAIAGTTSLKGVTFRGSVMYAIMDGLALNSINGISWARYSTLPSTTVTSIAYASSGTDLVLSITGSKNWISDGGGAVTAGTAPANLAINWVGDELAGVNRSGELWHSSDGLLWQNLITPTPGTTTIAAIPAYTFNAVAKFGSTYIAVGDSGVIQSYVVGGTWAPQTSAGTSLGTNGVAWNQKVGASALYVAVGWGMSWTSPDAVTWTEHAQSGMNMVSVIWAGSYFVAVGNGLWVSSDGITWTLKLNPPSTGNLPSVYAISWLNGTPYALGYSETAHKVMYSQGDNTGFGWSSFLPVTGPVGEQWAMLGLTKSDGGLYLAVGWGGRVLTTTKPANGVWAQTVVPLAAGEDFVDVLWTNDSARSIKQFTAVTSKGGIWTSANGTTWTKRKTASRALWCITRTDQARTSVDGTPVSSLDAQFIAAGDHGLLVTSFNGIEWQEADMGTSQYINQILWVPGTTTTTRTDTTGTNTVNVTTASPDGSTAGAETTTTVTITTVTTNLYIETNPPIRIATSTAPTTSTSTSTGTTLITTTGAQPPTAADPTSTTVAGPQADTPGQLIAAGGLGAFLVSNGTVPSQPSVSFGLATDAITEGGTTGGSATLNFTLSTALTVDVTIPLVFTGSTAPKTAYKLSAPSIVFKAGQTAQTITITAVNDGVAHGDKTVVIGFGAPAADVSILTGSILSETVTIHDANLAPVVSATVSAPSITNAASALVAKGAAITFNSTLTQGTGTISYQWKRNGAVISGAIHSSYSLPGATLAQAGAYTVTAKNTAGSATSATVELAVVDGSPQYITAKTGVNVTLTAAAAGDNLLYQWSGPSGGVVMGQTGKTYVVSGSVSGIYTCAVRFSTGAALITGGINLTFVAGPPALAAAILTLPPGSVAFSYSFTPLTAIAASRWAVSGLPPGLVYSASTGAISGTPTRGGTYRVVMVASNALGSSTFVATLTVNSMPPSTVGNFVATVAVDPTVNAGLGGRLNLTTTSVGAFSGSLVDSTGSSPFTGTLVGAPGTSNLSGNAVVGARTVHFTFDESSVLVTLVTGSVSSGGGVASITCVQQATAAASRSGHYTCVFAPTDPAQYPGYGFVTVNAAGTVNLTIALPGGEGAKATISTIIGPGVSSVYAIPVYVPLNVPAFTGLASVLGQVALTEKAAPSPSYSSNTLSGVPQLIQGVAPTSTDLTVDGGRYTPPAKGTIVMGLQAKSPNATLTFAGADLATDSRHPSGDITVTSIAAVSGPSTTANTFLQFTPATGEFGGTFSLLDPDTNAGTPRTGQFFGVVIRPGGSSTMVGEGYLVLPTLPAGGVLFGSVNIASKP